MTGKGLMKLMLEKRMKDERRKRRPTMGMIDDLHDESCGEIMIEVENERVYIILKSRIYHWQAKDDDECMIVACYPHLCHIESWFTVHL